MCLKLITMDLFANPKCSLNGILYDKIRGELTLDLFRSYLNEEFEYTLKKRFKEELGMLYTNGFFQTSVRSSLNAKIVSTLMSMNIQPRAIEVKVKHLSDRVFANSVKLSKCLNTRGCEITLTSFLHEIRLKIEALKTRLNALEKRKASG